MIGRRIALGATWICLVFGARDLFGLGGMMRRFVFLFVDVFLLALATVAAQLLRDNLEIHTGRFVDIAPYLVMSCAVGAIVLTAMRVNRHIWRFSSFADYQRLVYAVTLTVVIAVGLTFAINRLDGISRSLPILQGLLAVSFMVGARVLFRVHHLRRDARKTAAVPLTVVADQAMHSVLVIGLSRLTETYLQSLAELERGRVQVVGLLGRSDRHLGRRAASQKILGLPEDVGSVLAQLSVHGVVVDRIVVTMKISELSSEARAALLEIDDADSVEVQYIGEALGFDAPGAIRRATLQEPPSVAFRIPDEQLVAISRRGYWTVKRGIDIAAAGALLVLLVPLWVLTAVLVAVSVGFPLAFWQQRPGLGGVPFRLYKFRTMRPAHAPDGRLLADAERVSWVGDFLRRTRLDELPQLMNILRGEMSFVGPRPLLPRDQAKEHRARLLVRPGLTGWAQVVGGRRIKADDKAALDIWYVQNASLALDAKIVFQTLRMITLGESLSIMEIRRAWRELGTNGVVQSSTANVSPLRTVA